MLFYIFLSILIVNVSSERLYDSPKINGRHNGHNYHSSVDSSEEIKKSQDNHVKNGFYVEALKDSNYGQKFPYIVDTNYLFKNGDTIELTCHYQLEGKTATVQWQETKYLGTINFTNVNRVASRIRLTLNNDDNGLRLTCHAYGSHEQKTITVSFSTHKRDDTGIEAAWEKIILQPNSNYTADEKCHGVVNYPHKTSKAVQPNERIIKNFDEKFNGTNLFCIEYKDLGLITSDIKQQNPTFSKVQTFERVKRKYIFFIGNDDETKKEWDPENKHSFEPNNEQSPKNFDIYEPVKGLENGDRKNDSSTTAVAIVGGVLGTIIFILSSILFTIWYKKKIRQSNFDGAADQVIYAEIEDAPPKLPPPRRQESPYAKILGILVPVTEEQTNDDLYCSMD